MEQQAQLLLYLDGRRILFDMKNQSETFVNNLTLETVSQFPPFRYCLEVDVMDLLDVFPAIGKLLLLEPLKWQRFCNKILYASIQSLEHGLIESVQMSQVAVTLRLKNVSQLMVEPSPRTYRSLISLKGQLVDVSKPSPYVYHTVWSCPEECDGNEVILSFIPKVPPKCCVCRSSLYENGGLRRCGEQVIVTIKHKNDVLPKTFKIVDDLTAQIKLGSFYSINAVVLKKSTEVWSMEIIAPLLAPVTAVVPRDIQELYEACEGTPWKFIYCLASTIGVNMCPLNCFIHLKITLLLSLTSVKANALTESRLIHVLATGLDTGIVGAIMREGAKLANTSLSLGTSNTVGSAALIACTGGVCFMPLPIHTYYQKLTSSILSSIESGEILYNNGKTKLQCAVWAQGMDFRKHVIFNIANVFGTVCRGDSGEYEDDIAEYLLQRAMDPAVANNEEKEAMKDVARYIDLAAGTQVDLDDAAETLLRNYFLAARKEKPRVVSIGSLDSLVAICMTSARLCRRSIASIEDATFAIWLHVSGCPEPRFAPDEYLQTPSDIKQLQTVFDSFKNWLTEFTSTYGY